MIRFLLGLLALAGWMSSVIAQTNPAPQALPYSQNFSSFTGTGSAYPAGWQGWTITGSTSTSFPTAAPSGNQVLATGATAANSAVSAFVGDAVGKIAFLNTSSAMKSFVLAINTTGASSVQVQWTAATQRQQINNRIGAMGLQYRVGTSGTFTNLAASEYQNPGGSDNVAGTGGINPQNLSVTLPADCNNQPEVQLRWVYREVSGGGNRPGFSVTNVSVAAGTAPPPASLTASSLMDFGSLTVGQGSLSQTSTLNGTNLTGAPGNLMVSASSSSFQVSADNSSWSSSASIPYATGTLSNGSLFVRFFPQATGPQNGTISISGGGLANAVTISVSGTGLAASTPVLSATSLAGFGNICLNTTAGPNSFTITGTNLENAEVEVGPLAGFSFATSSGGPFEPSLLLDQPGGAYSQEIFVRFTPTAVIGYSGNIPVTGGGAPAVSVSVMATGVNSAPSLTTGSASAITTTTATTSGTITATGCTSVTAYGIEYSLTNNFATGTGTVVSSSNLSGGVFTAALTGLTASTTIYYRAFATNQGGTGYGPQQSFTTAAPPPPVLTATSLPAIGSVCLNNSAAPVSFSLTGSNLTNQPVLVQAFSGMDFSTSLTGPFSNTLSFNATAGNLSQTVFVRFTPTVAQSYNGNLMITGGGLTNVVNVAVTAAGVNTPPVVSAGAASNITIHEATLTGSITDIGCSAVTRYGIEYSSIPGRPGGQGTQQVATGATIPGSFSVNVAGLVQNSVYYFRTFATNAGGTSYSAETRFETAKIPAALRIYNNPVTPGGTLAVTLDNVPSGNYAFRLINTLGQLVYQHNIFITGTFIDNTIPIPSTIQKGRYVLQIIEQARGVYLKAPVMVQ